MIEVILYENGVPVAISPEGDARENSKQYWKVPKRVEIARLRRGGLRDAKGLKKVVFQEEFIDFA